MSELRVEAVDIVAEALKVETRIEPFNDGFLLRGPEFGQVAGREYSAVDGRCLEIGSVVMESFTRGGYPDYRQVDGLNVATESTVHTTSAGESLALQKFHRYPVDMGSFGIAGLFAHFEKITDADQQLPLPLLAYYWKSRGISAESPLLANMGRAEDVDRWQNVVDAVYLSQ